MAASQSSKLFVRVRIPPFALSRGGNYHKLVTGQDVTIQGWRTLAWPSHGQVRCPTGYLHSHDGDYRRGVGEFGRPRWFHMPEIAGSNPASATVRY